MSKIDRRTMLQAMILSGCGPSLMHFPFDRGESLPGGTLFIKYYSVGCFLCRFDGVAFLTDPFWSHLPFSQVAFGKTLPNSQAIAPYLSEISDVSSIFVCHNHYDHNLALPHIAQYIPQSTKIFGSKTLEYTFAPNNLKQPFVAVNSDVATADQMGRRLYAANGRMRILP